jgi:hypothetical protein
MTAVLVKVQLPVDTKLARDTGKLYADLTNHTLLVYDKNKKHVWQGSDDTLRQFLLSAGGGVGFMKAFLLAAWGGDHWEVDYAAGFQPLANW